jgi:hypothetical protein
MIFILIGFGHKQQTNWDTRYVTQTKTGEASGVEKEIP